VMDKNKNIIARSPSIPQDIRAEAISKDVIALPFDKLRARNDSLPELPKGWVWTRLGEVSEIILGQSPPSSTYNKNGNGLPFYQGKLEFGNIYPTLGSHAYLVFARFCLSEQDSNFDSFNSPCIVYESINNFFGCSCFIKHIQRNN